MGKQFSDRVENIVGKEEIARYEQFLLFLQCFQKLSVVDALKLVSIKLRNKSPDCLVEDFELGDNKTFNHCTVHT